jgi:hypothetical protein
MELNAGEYGYSDFARQATGSGGEDYRIISYPFDKYEIKVRLSPRNEFVGIVEVKVNKDFLSHQQRIGIQTHLDVDKYYRE